VQTTRRQIVIEGATSPALTVPERLPRTPSLRSARMRRALLSRTQIGCARGVCHDARAESGRRPTATSGSRPGLIQGVAAWGSTVWPAPTRPIASFPAPPPERRSARLVPHLPLQCWFARAPVHSRTCERRPCGKMALSTQGQYGLGYSWLGNDSLSGGHQRFRQPPHRDTRGLAGANSLQGGVVRQAFLTPVARLPCPLPQCLTVARARANGSVDIDFCADPAQIRSLRSRSCWRTSVKAIKFRSQSTSVTHHRPLQGPALP